MTTPTPPDRIGLLRKPLTGLHLVLALAVVGALASSLSAGPGTVPPSSGTRTPVNPNALV